MYKTSLFQPLIISLVLHLAALLLSVWLPPAQSLRSKPLDVEIVYQNETDNKKNQQFVTDPNPQLKDELDKLKDKVRFLSRTAQRVKEESVARKSGPTQNASRSQSITKQSDARPAAQNSLNEMERPSISAPMPDAITQKTRTSSAGESVAIGDASIAEFIPEVRDGGFTSLNTDQFLFYTFYARINEQIRNRWIMNIRSFLRNISREEMGQLSQKRQISEVEIVLSPDGKFLKAFVHQKAENNILDQAAIAAFKLAAPFNNPPVEIVDKEDGLIHLHYQFHVQFQPRYMAGK